MVRKKNFCNEIAKFVSSIVISGGLATICFREGNSGGKGGCGEKRQFCESGTAVSLTRGKAALCFMK